MNAYQGKKIDLKVNVCRQTIRLSNHLTDKQETNSIKESQSIFKKVVKLLKLFFYNSILITSKELAYVQIFDVRVIFHFPCGGLQAW